MGHKPHSGSALLRCIAAFKNFDFRRKVSSLKAAALGVLCENERKFMPNDEVGQKLFPDEGLGIHSPRWSKDGFTKLH